ncbi:unnamed protein product, partial [Ectocarpus sp. 13 AM-2016]
MVSLRKLDISKNRLSSIANEHLANLDHLQVLILSRNELRDLPPALGKLSKLQHLVISKPATRRARRHACPSLSPCPLQQLGNLT